MISTTGGMLEGREQEVHRIATKWIRRLNSSVKYDLSGKMFVFQELDPAEEGSQHWHDIFARVNGYCDTKGKWLPEAEKDRRVRRGDYSLVLIELLTWNWHRFSSSFLEDNIIHELMHVVRPQIGRLIKNGELIEDEDYMHKITRKLVKDYGRITKSDKEALMRETIIDRQAYLTAFFSS